MFSPADDAASFDRLKSALIKMDQGIAEDTQARPDEDRKPDHESLHGMHIPQAAMSAADAYGRGSVVRHWGPDIIGRISSSYICLYPPGVPLVVPGEIIDDEVYGLIDQGLKTGLHITGLRDGRVTVIE